MDHSFITSDESPVRYIFTAFLINQSDEVIEGDLFHCSQIVLQLSSMSEIVGSCPLCWE